jgi:putative spermidine/putrescine transport system permease protein
VKPRLITRILGGAYGLLVAAYLVLPALAVVPIAFSSNEFLQFPPKGFSTRWVTAFFNDPQWMQALTRSVVIALLTAVIAVPVGTVAAYAMVRGHRRLQAATEPILMLPLLVPVVISGFALYLMTLVLRVHGGLFLVLLGHVGLSIPFVVTVVLAAMRTFDWRLLQAARVSGANAAQAFLKILVPVIAPAIGAAALIAIMTSLDEAVIALFLVGDTAPTLPVKMFSSITYALNPLVPVAATVLTLATIMLLVLSLLLMQLNRRRARVALGIGPSTAPAVEPNPGGPRP